ncbi:hypothetical protein ACL6C3_29800 [Capilliphycus salinus ALCB114379]|uniref:hypothetical protein n=1 Tax=Capilliphycus salinus TaxID=2768948 RepID=UPI0039A6EB31
MVPMAPERLRFIIALPMLLMLSGTSNLANSAEIQPLIRQPQGVSEVEMEDATQMRPMKPFSPEVFYDRTPCKLYGQC